ncbi:MAG: pyridoxal-phosphate dependent enzyme [Bacteroidales bacterium]|nr:pyridoxal-phosphate dependent enzyme [Bacteroidales bacterium]
MHKDYIFFQVPTQQDIIKAADRISNYVHQTPVLSSTVLNEIAGCEMFFKCENFQKVGAFKSRGAVNALFSISDSQLRNGVCTHSSGNHAQALARAASLKSVPAYIVMPSNAPTVKVDAVKSYGGQITFCEPNLQARESALAQIQHSTGATEIHPYDNLKVIEGQATVAFELLQQVKNPDFILTPVGGGGLLSGVAIATSYFSPATKVIASEPLGASDAFESFYNKKFIPSQNPNTIADGLLTSLGKYTFPIILKYVNSIITVDELQIIEALKLIYQRLKIVVEPSSAVVLAAVLSNRQLFSNKRVVLVLSGGNVDFDTLKRIL